MNAPLVDTVGSDPLELWMSSGIIDCKDPVMWWSSQLDSKVSVVDPALARMAIDLLSAPGMFDLLNFLVIDI